jgi:hypothetical protein
MLDAANPEEARVWHGPLVVSRPIRRDIHTKGQRKISPCCEQKSQAAYTESGPRTAGPVDTRWTLARIGVASARPRPPGRERLEPLQVIWGESDPAGSDILLQVHPPRRRAAGNTASSRSRVHNDHSLCSAAIGWVAAARSRLSTLASESPR